MKKNVLALTLVAVCMMFASCGKESDEPGSDMVPATVGDSQQAESGDPVSDEREQPEAGDQASQPQDLSAEKADEQTQKELAAGESGEEQTDVLLSDKLLKAGDTMEVLYPADEQTLEPGLEVTLRSAKLSATPEEAQLDRALMEERTENYDLSGNPVSCGIDEAEILTCDLTVRNVNEEQGEDLHIGELMIAYGDPTTGKVSILSSMPVYFSASSSSVGKSDYYHYALPKGESKEMTVAWLIPGEYEAENLFLGVTYDNKEPVERQYFRLFGQE